MAGGSRIIISSEARNVCHSREDGQCLENSKRESSYRQTFRHRPIYICGEAAADLAFPLGKGVVSRKAVSSYRSLPPWGRGTASAVDRVLSQTAHLRRSSSLFFITLVPYPARFARHLPHAGKALSVGILFLHVSCIRFDDARKAASSYHRITHWGRGTASAVDRVLSYNGVLEMISLALFHTAFPIQPPPLRGTSFHRKEGVSTRAPSLGRGCRAQRGGVGFLFGRRSRLLFAFPLGKALR